MEEGGCEVGVVVVVFSKELTELRDGIIIFVESFNQLVRQAGESIKNVFDISIMDGYEFEEGLNDYQQPHKLDFTRSVINHQVLDNKPRNLIKKVIR